VIVTGRWLKTAVVRDEEWQTAGIVADPDTFLEAVRQSGLKADILRFVPASTDRVPRQSHRLEWDNVAAVRITTFADWWENRLPQVSRKNVRRSQRRGVTVKVVKFDEALVQGIKSIYDETPLRQGRKFWHYGKDLDTVRLENSTYADRSDFIGAYFGDELIGFLKMVYVRDTARIMQILSKNAHFDKRPTNALLAKAVERCCEKKMQMLIYGKYTYDNRPTSPITEFKRRNGFEPIPVPCCYVPLSMKGRLVLATRLHLGVKRLIPEKLLNRLLDWRTVFYRRTMPVAATETSGDA
jgi:hypothetical protein